MARRAKATLSIQGRADPPLANSSLTIRRPGSSTTAYPRLRSSAISVDLPPLEHPEMTTNRPPLPLQCPTARDRVRLNILSPIVRDRYPRIVVVRTRPEPASNHPSGPRPFRSPGDTLHVQWRSVQTRSRHMTRPVGRSRARLVVQFSASVIAQSGQRDDPGLGIGESWQLSV